MVNSKYVTSWNFTATTFKKGFEEWYTSASNSRIYMGIMSAGWAGMVIGFKFSSSTGYFAVIRSGGVSMMCKIENGVFNWII